MKLLTQWPFHVHHNTMILKSINIFYLFKRQKVKILFSGLDLVMSQSS